MHSFHGKTAYFHHHGDFCGEVHIARATEKLEREFLSNANELIEIAKTIASAPKEETSFAGGKLDYNIGRDSIFVLDRSTGDSLEISANDIVDLVGYRYVQSELISRIEQMDSKDLVAMLAEGKLD